MSSHEDGQGASALDIPERATKRAYREVLVSPHDGGWVVALDGRAAATPAHHLLVLSTPALAHAVGREWAAQGELIDPRIMPLTRLANSAIDGVARESEAVRVDLVKYASSDLLCYRASEPTSLVEAQSAAWDPVLLWAREALGARFILTEGVVFVAQPSQALAAVRRAVDDTPIPFALAALHAMTALMGSVLLALAAAHGRLSAEQAWRAAHVDEDEQTRVWGEDAEAVQRRERRWTDMAAAAQMIALLRL